MAEERFSGKLIRDTIVAVLGGIVIEPTLRKLNFDVSPYLRHIWFGIFLFLVLDVWWRSKNSRIWASTTFARFSQRGKIMSYLIVALIGAGFSCGMWFVVTKSIGKDSPEKTTETPEKPKPLPTFQESDMFFVSLGSNTIGLFPDGRSSTILAFNSVPIITGRVKDGRVLISANLLKSGTQPIQIIDNQLMLAEATWDRNYNDQALEVVDEDLNPILQVVYRTSHNVAVYGVFPTPVGPVWAGPAGYGKKEQHFKRIFKYPSRKHLGQELDE